jgi:hypothetical protein
MSTSLDKDGYSRLNLSSGTGKRKHFRIHYLVAISFIGLPTKRKNEVNHKNKNRQDNNIFNLEWCTRKFNLKHRNKKIRGLSYAGDF